MHDFIGQRPFNPNPSSNLNKQKPDNMDDSSSKFSLQFGRSIDQHSDEEANEEYKYNNNAIEEVSEDEHCNSEKIEMDRINPVLNPIHNANMILNDKYISKPFLQKKIKRSNSLQQDLAKDKLDHRQDYMDVNSEQYLQNENDVKHIMLEIQRVVQHGGNMCHRSFRSFGES